MQPTVISPNSRGLRTFSAITASSSSTATEVGWEVETSHRFGELLVGSHESRYGNGEGKVCRCQMFDGGLVTCCIKR